MNAPTTAAAPRRFGPDPETVPAPPAPVGTEARVCADIARRQQVGIAKYGMTVAANPLPLRAWLQHAYEETLDQAVYLRRAIEDLDAQAAVPINPTTPSA